MGRGAAVASSLPRERAPYVSQILGSVYRGTNHLVVEAPAAEVALARATAATLRPLRETPRNAALCGFWRWNPEFGRSCVARTVRPSIYFRLLFFVRKINWREIGLLRGCVEGGTHASLGCMRLLPESRLCHCAIVC